MINKLPNKQKLLLGIGTVLGVLILVVVGILIAVCVIIQDGKTSLAQTASVERITPDEEAFSSDDGKTVEYNNTRYLLNENMVSLCILGFDRETVSTEGEGAGQADVVIVATLNIDTNEMKLISVPRESMVEVNEYRPDGTYTGSATMALCLAYAFGDGSHTSCENTTQALSKALHGIAIPSDLALDLSGITPLNNAVGGVELTALETIPESSITKDQDILLLGEDARRYVQWRDESVLESPLHRQARQTQYVKAFAAQLPSKVVTNPSLFLELYNVVKDHSVTNLDMNELAYLVSALATQDASALDVITLEGEMRHGESYGEFYLDEKSVYEAILATYYHQES